MFKTNTELIVIEAKATKPITTDVVFWSHDHGTAKLIFKLQKDGISQSLAEGTIVPILLEFNSSVSENGRGRHIYQAEIVDALNGIASIVLEDNILGYIGRVDGSIYIELPDSRSLDTAGRFTFDIKRSPIDENVPELEDYYWQGFSEIMTQYHQTIATIKLEAKELLDSLSVDVTKVKNDIVTANTRIAEINQKIDDNDVFTKQESSANVVNQIAGKKEANLKIDIDFANKIRGSLVENPNWAGAKLTDNSDFPKPNSFTTEFTQERYTNTSKSDGNLASIFGSGEGKFICILQRWNVLESVKRGLFDSLGKMDLISQIGFLKKSLTVSTLSQFGYGTYPAGYKMSIALFNSKTNTYTDLKISEATSSTQIVVDVEKEQLADALTDEGYVYVLVYSGISDGTKSSLISLDYSKFEIGLNVSANDVIHSMIATNHVQNLATQAEAEAGTDNKKSMTPLGTAQQIEKKAVTVASNQTIGGIKNFKDGLLLDSKTVITQQNADATYAVKSIGMSLWTGISTLNENHIVTPTKKMSECQNGWLLVFAPYNGSTAQNYDVTTVFVPKGHTRLSIVQIFNGSNWTQKRYQCSDSTITGHSSNVGTEQIKASLIEVREV